MTEFALYMLHKLLEDSVATAVPACMILAMYDRPHATGQLTHSSSAQHG
jgi:hypothetical protein